MELVRKLARLTRLGEPGAASFVCQALLGAVLILIFWLADAVLDYLVQGDRTFLQFLFHPDAHEVSDFALVLFLVCCLLLYSRRSHRIETRLEEALQQALDKAEGERAKLEGIVEAMGDAISIQDPDLNVLYQNRAHQQLTGYSVGRPCYEAYRKRSTVCEDCHLMAAFEDGEVHRSELGPGTSATGGYVEIIGSALRTADGAPLYGIEVVRDITARKSAEREAIELNTALTRQAQELKQTNQELESFCQAISHDLRAPLTRVYSSAQELKGYRELLDDNGRFFVDLVHDGCVQMEELLDSLMVLCRVTQVEIERTELNLVPVALEITARLRQDYEGHCVSFQAPERVVANGDASLVRVVLENLLSNAWKYTSGTPSPAVELGTIADPSGETVFFVRDNGAGFDGARADQLFQPFKRLHSYRDFPGTGLGLATVRRIVRRHNGRIWAEGEPGKGASFYFTLPR